MIQLSRISTTCSWRQVDGRVGMCSSKCSLVWYPRYMARSSTLKINLMLKPGGRSRTQAFRIRTYSPQNLKWTCIARMQLHNGSWRESLTMDSHHPYVTFYKLNKATTCINVLLVTLITSGNVALDFIKYLLHMMDNFFFLATWLCFYKQRS